jgi:hypothetical protein
VFRKSILKKEKAFNYQGLWESINFINHKNIYEYSNKLGFTTKNDLNINLRLIKRLYKDKTFKSRNYIYYLLLQFVPLKLIRYIFNLKIFEFKLPYIKLILLKK